MRPEAPATAMVPLLPCPPAADAETETSGERLRRDDDFLELILLETEAD